jgi:hypothetical protein
MEQFQAWFNESPLASYLRSLFGVVVALAVADFVKVGQFDFSGWQMWFIAALSATLPVLSRLLNPKDELSL